MPDVRSMVRFARPGGGHLELGPQAIESLMAMRQLEEDQPEAGGVLLGRLIVNTEDVVVDEVTTPSLADTRSRYFFLDRCPIQRGCDSPPDGIPLIDLRRH